MPAIIEENVEDIPDEPEVTVVDQIESINSRN